MSFYERWRELRGLTQQAFEDRWNRQNYRHATHGGEYEPELSEPHGRAALLLGMDALEELARTDNDQAAEATVEFLQAVTWGEEPDEVVVDWRVKGR